MIALPVFTSICGFGWFPERLGLSVTSTPLVQSSLRLHLMNGLLCWRSRRPQERVTRLYFFCGTLFLSSCDVGDEQRETNAGPLQEVAPPCTFSYQPVHNTFTHIVSHSLMGRILDPSMHQHKYPPACITFFFFFYTKIWFSINRHTHDLRVAIKAATSVWLNEDEWRRSLAVSGDLEPLWTTCYICHWRTLWTFKTRPANSTGGRLQRSADKSDLSKSATLKSGGAAVSGDWKRWRTDSFPPRPALCMSPALSSR